MLPLTEAQELSLQGPLVPLPWQVFCERKSFPMDPPNSLGASVTMLCWGVGHERCFHSVCKKLPCTGFNQQLTFSRLNQPGFEGYISLVRDPHDSIFPSHLPTGNPSRMTRGRASEVVLGNETQSRQRSDDSSQLSAAELEGTSCSQEPTWP